MLDFYREKHREYFEKTVNMDPSSFLAPFAAQLPPGSFILDIGCGSGRDMLWLKNRGYSVKGFERSPELAALARKNSGCEVIEGDFTTYDFYAAGADAVILIGALVHIPHGDFEAVLRHISYALKQKGLMLITAKEGRGKKEGSDGRIFHLFQKQELEAVFTAAGFRIKEFARSVSKTGTGEIWLQYILEKEILQGEKREREENR
jgi:SAM-dependent methyltransferase